MGFHAVHYESAREFVPESNHGDDELWTLGIRFQLSPQPRNMHIHCPAREMAVVTPDFAQQLFARECYVGMLDKITEQLELLGGHWYDLPVARDLCAPRVH